MAAMILLGYMLKRLGVFRTEDAKVLSKIIIHVTLPAALMNSFREFHFESDYFSMIAISAFCNASLMFFGLWLARKKDMSEKALYSMNLSSYNIGCFMLPVAQGLLLPEAVVAASMFDAGNCPFNSGISYALVSAGGQGESVRPGFVVNKLLHSVPFMSYLILMTMNLLHIHLPDEVYEVTAGIGGANTIMAMLMIGILFEVRVQAESRKKIASILLLRYSCNLIFAGIVWLLPLSLLLRQVAVLIILAPVPSVTMVYCEKCGCKSEEYGAINSLSIAISLVLTFLIIPIFLT